ncbi:MAG: diphthine--ammonia ligase [Candidatus Thorarchaeota archaeon]
MCLFHNNCEEIINFFASTSDPMQVTCLVSGGKDSIFALGLALLQFEVTSIITIRSSCDESQLFHLPNCQHVQLIAEMLDIPHQFAWIDSCDVDEEIQGLTNALIKAEAEAVITGGIQSEFQRYKFNLSAQRAGMRCFNPLWRVAPQQLMLELLDHDFHIIFTAIAGMGLKKDLLGTKLTSKILDRLKVTSHGSEIAITGEGGSYESFVLDAPFFPARILIKDSIIHWDRYREEGYLEILRVETEQK